MAKKESAVLALFVVLPGTKWNESHNERNVKKFIDALLKCQKCQISSFAVFKNALELKTVQKHARKNDVKLHEEFLRSSNQ